MRREILGSSARDQRSLSKQAFFVSILLRISLFAPGMQAAQLLFEACQRRALI
jgi:hypothetical protein